MEDTSTACCKLTRVADNYSLSEDVEQFPDKWAQGESLRSLALEFNTTVFRRLAVEHDAYPSASESRQLMKNAYQKSGTVSEQAIEEIEEMGIDYEHAKRNYFISRQTVLNHFRDCLEIEKEKGDSGETFSNVSSPRTSLQNAQEQYEERIRSGISRAIDADETDLRGVGQIEINATVICEGCGDRVDLREIFRKGCCSCEDGSTPVDAEGVVQ